MTTSSAPTEMYIPPLELTLNSFLMDRNSFRNALFSRKLIPDLSRDLISAIRLIKIVDPGVGSPSDITWRDEGATAAVASITTELNASTRQIANRLNVFFFMFFSVCRI